MNDYQRIANLIADYSRIYDDGDFEGYARLFEHGRVTGPVGEFETMEQILDYHRNHVVRRDGRPDMMHAITNLKIGVEDGADTATAECYVIIYSAAPGMPLRAVFVGSYFDTFHRIDGKWWFKSRHCEPRFYGDLGGITQPGDAPTA